MTDGYAIMACAPLGIGVLVSRAPLRSNTSAIAYFVPAHLAAAAGAAALLLALWEEAVAARRPGG